MAEPLTKTARKAWQRYAAMYRREGSPAGVMRAEELERYEATVRAVEAERDAEQARAERLAEQVESLRWAILNGMHDADSIRVMIDRRQDAEALTAVSALARELRAALDPEEGR